MAFLLPSSWQQRRRNGRWGDGDDDDEGLFDEDEEGEGMVGLGVGAGGRGELDRDVGVDEGRLSRDLEEGFRDDSEEEREGVR